MKEYITGGLAALAVAGALTLFPGIKNITDFGSQTLETQTQRVHIGTDNSQLKGISEAGHEYFIDAKNRNLGQYDNLSSKDIRGMNLTDIEKLRTQGSQYHTTHDFMENAEDKYEALRTKLQMMF
ncbi:MAG: hypothetical protein ABIJ18_03170 [archaeon]